ncbi:MAG: serine hydrolase domain-containing protein [Acidobacteriota bacterium]
MIRRAITGMQHVGGFALLVGIWFLAGPAFASDTVCRPNDNLAVVAAELDKTIIAGMRGNRVPGVSVALIRDGRLVWAKGYGHTNSFFDSAVSADTVFPVASLGKPVTAYTFLKLVEAGRVRIDAPLAPQLKRRWLPATPQNDSITAFQLLTHQSGLGNAIRSRKRSLKFPPGTSFSYSGVGYMYLQEAVAQRSGMTFENAVQSLALAPAGMTSSSFTHIVSPNPAAAGHTPLRTPVIIFGVFIGIVFAALLLPFLVLHRLIARKWLPSARAVAAYVAACGGMATAVMTYMTGRGPGFFFGGIGCLLLLATFVTWLALHKLRPASSPAGILLTGLLAVGLPALLVLANWQRPMPLPNVDERDGNAAASFRSTAPDLARFLVHVMHEAQARPAGLVAKMLVPAVSTGPRSGWGLGFGIYEAANDRIVWHRGSSPAYQSVLAMCPRQGYGVVVLSNATDGEDLVKAVAARALGGTAPWDEN